MKIRTEVEIDASPAEVWAAFDDPERRRRWQPSLQREEQVSGKAGERGSVSRRLYSEDGRQTPIVEIVTERREPHFAASSLEAPRYTATIVNHFEAAGHGTRWVSYANIRFHGLRRFVSPWLKGALQQRSDEDMQRFKLMIESDLAERDT